MHNCATVAVDTITRSAFQISIWWYKQEQKVLHLALNFQSVNIEKIYNPGQVDKQHSFHIHEKHKYSLQYWFDRTRFYRRERNCSTIQMTLWLFTLWFVMIQMNNWISSVVIILLKSHLLHVRNPQAYSHGIVHRHLLVTLVTGRVTADSL